MELKENEFPLKTIFKTKHFTYENIESIDIKEDGRTSHLVIHLKRPLYVRKSLSFTGINKDSDVFKFLNEKIKSN